jgi:hypothetical protein
MSPETLGSALSSTDGKLAVIAVNFGSIANDPRVPGKATQLRETLLHEIGHALLNQKLVDLQARVEATLSTEDQVNNELSAALQRSGALRANTDQKAIYLKRLQKLQAESKATGKSPATANEVLLYQAIMQEYYAWASQRLSDPLLERFRTIWK